MRCIPWSGCSPISDDDGGRGGRQGQPGQGQAPLLAGGEHPGRQLRQRAEAEGVQRRIRLAAPEAGEEIEVLPRRQRRLQRILVREVAEPGGMAGAAWDVAQIFFWIAVVIAAVLFVLGFTIYKKVT